MVRRWRESVRVVLRYKRSRPPWRLLWLIGLRVEPAARGEDLGQPFRLADHHHVTGIHLDERLHTAERFNIFALHSRHGAPALAT
jgi:hypothetical protein